MKNPLSDAGLDLLFREARTYNGWLEGPVSHENSAPALRPAEAGPDERQLQPDARSVPAYEGKARLRPALAPGNVDKVMSAPVTAIIAYDLNFYEKLPVLFPHNPGMLDHFAHSPELVETTAKRNSSLQGTYLILAARALGLGCGPMSGFDNAKVDEAFFGAGKSDEGSDQEFFPEGHIKSNFLCNLRYGDDS
ncbi:malonic semialdehyde reductase [Paraburkholderia sp. BL10I2N1]|uniref:malonic semialdehyde reductase n=1 Tax=Paraburkholderia sp. BL10I2N1 TaxID=1938796 RepID=UPI0010610014|nr:malonic semialdehyde reductase [Paraburkholderia sp. BL10I2N1]TDN61999.1 3-hydroxypropanoate dehydrogenase [Paraburkholderia sp. BL10I2N1]